MTEDIPYPVIDLQEILNSTAEDQLKNVGEKILASFQTTGYVYLKNYGLEVEDVKRLISCSNKFFDMSEDFKIQFKRSTKTFHGYTNEAHETLDPSIPEQATAARNTWDIQDIDEPFPEQEVPDFRASSKNIIDKLIPTATQLLQCLELGLGMKKGCLVDSHKLMLKEGNTTDLKTVRYMPPDQEEKVNRLGAHLDISVITLQLYGDLEGLELLDNSGEWKESQLYPGYALLFPGQSLEIWSGGIIKPLMHRVVIPKTEEGKKKPRHAVIFFVQPDNEAMLAPFNGRTDLFQPIKAFDFIEGRAKELFKYLY